MYCFVCAITGVAARANVRMIAMRCIEIPAWLDAARLHMASRGAIFVTVAAFSSPSCHSPSGPEIAVELQEKPKRTIPSLHSHGQIVLNQAQPSEQLVADAIMTCLRRYVVFKTVKIKRGVPRLGKVQWYLHRRSGLSAGRCPHQLAALRRHGHRQLRHRRSGRYPSSQAAGEYFMSGVAASRPAGLDSRYPSSMG
jgi:hypothetical protein